MKVVFHIGAHCTDDGQLVGTLLKNRARLAEAGAVVAYPGRYRTLLRETLQALDGAPAPAELQQTLLDSIVDEDAVGRLVLSNEHFLGTTARALGAGQLYPMAEARAGALCNLFPGAVCEFHLAIRNPAAFLPAVFGRLRDIDYGSFTAGTDPLTLRWSDMVGRLRAGAPGVPLTVWCDEDTPLIWPEVLRGVAGAGPEMELVGENGRLAEVMTREGLQRLDAYLQARPPADAGMRRRITAAFLDKFARDEALEEELELPGWTHAYVEALTAAFEADLAVIAGMDGVTFLSA